jgi:hypothetical protein
MKIFASLLALCALCVGCSPVDGNRVIDAEGTPAFFTWQRRVGDELPPETKQNFEDALQEIRYHITDKAEASGRDPIETALCGYIHGKTVNAAILLGFGFKWQRLEAQRSMLKKVLAADGLLVTKPGDLQAADDLAAYRARHQKQFDDFASQLKHTEQVLTALGAKIPQPVADEKPEPIAIANRDDALKEISAMIEGRRRGGLLKYGEHPFTLDRDGAKLDDDERRAFETKKPAAAAAGRIAIAVKIKGRWLIYEGRREAPTLPDAVSSKLTPDDRQKFLDDWINLEAELWAREVAEKFEP